MNRATHLPDYVELHAVSNYSFLRGGSHPEELIERALALGYRGLALTDEASLAGVVRAHLALRKAREAGVPGAATFHLLLGSEFEVADPTPFKLVVLACHRIGYGLLCEFITRLRRSSPGKGLAPLKRDDIRPAAWGDCLVLLIPQRHTSTEAITAHTRWLRQHFADRCWLGVALHHHLDDAVWLRTLRHIGDTEQVPLVATGDVHMHLRSRKPLQDVLTATRVGSPLAECGLQLARHAEHHLRSRLRLAQRYPADLLQATQEVASRCAFSLDELRYEYPDEIVPAGETARNFLCRVSTEGLVRRYPQGVPARVQAQMEAELALITELDYEKYFLTVYDIVCFARSRHILCQGRGSAANSVVCYALGITEVDPEQSTLLFERFISRERNEPPDIDVDFEHERREEVIQYLYTRYGRDRAALTATVITYRTRSALRDVGKALGFGLDEIERASGNLQWWDSQAALAERLQEIGLDPSTRRVQQWLELTRTLVGFPRHLSQHTGGFVLSRGALCRMVPIENANMPERSVIQWDKDDLDALGLLKVDVLALGMLTALRKAMDFIGQWRGQPFGMQDIPREDPACYEMMCRADTIGVFQIESRAQMSMLPRLKPREFYDLVVEVALVRPGPIQGGMVHPYLRRRQGLEPIDYPRGLQAALKRTLGVPIFQEQVMQIAMIAAGFTAGEADDLRRSMAAWRRKGDVHKFKERIKAGMRANQYPAEFAEQICQQIEGFGSYGFPESHAASFALLVYASAWIKCHEPAAFLAGLLNAQPLGFYSPSQLVQDARRHGVEVRPPDVMCSTWDCSLELPYSEHFAHSYHSAPTSLPAAQARSSSTPAAPQSGPPADSRAGPAVRLGLRLLAGLSPDVAQRIAVARQQAPFIDVDDLARRADLDQRTLRALAAGDALMSLSGHRRQQVWEASALHRAPPLLREAPVAEVPLALPAAPEGEEIVFDYASQGLTLRRHPLALLRAQMNAQRLLSASELHGFPNGRLARACGIVTVRQQPGTASGVVFVTLEDETGTVNVIVWPALKERQRRELVHSRLLAVYGVWQREGEVRHLVAHRLRDLSPLLGRLSTHSRDFH
ncbi:MAG: error-prone DNA polymerase [Burkholderiales bacterium RIFCSPLOWO2_12_FULL_64_99]|nr:MAG: error-prone DNA polymerase [Burkholderiales bacterium RIFCSPHIGHO2_12_FULL_63_20]OGB67906.1 MAG: error-prone DNA polymerase [Burkholderiales bacterium RIFCSPLOWO2_12_FULL_64_99]